MLPVDEGENVLRRVFFSKRETKKGREEKLGKKEEKKKSWKCKQGQGSKRSVLGL